MQRTVLPLNILFFILALLLTAKILADVASYKLGRLAVSTRSNPVQQQSSPQVQRNTTLQSHAVILEKGLFGPATRGSLTPTLKTATNAAQTTAESDLILLGTAAGSPRSSFVLVRRTSSNEERVFRIGDKVFDLGTLTSVQKETAELRSGARTITLRTPTAPAEAAKPGSTAQPAAAGVVQAPAGGSGIIDQRALNAALDNIGQAMTDARLLPSVKDSKVEGFKVSEVKPQGVFAAVGLKNGDVLIKINEFPIDSPEKAIQSFMTLKGQNRIKLDLIRDGAPTTLAYDIR